MKQTERLMAMTTHDNGMSFEKATFAHLYMNREFLSQEFACGRMVFVDQFRDGRQVHYRTYNSH